MPLRSISLLSLRSLQCISRPPFKPTSISLSWRLLSSLSSWPFLVLTLSLYKTHLPVLINSSDTSRKKYSEFTPKELPSPPEDNAMRKIKALKLRNCLIRLSHWIQLKTRTQPRHYRLRRPQPPSKPKLAGKLLDVCRSLTNGAKALCSNNPYPSYVPVGRDPFAKETVTVPKGHLAVYIGQKDGEFHRILVPVVYFNHPLFGELLMEAEQEYGFQQPGGLTIPCGFTKFQRVQARIQTG